MQSFIVSTYLCVTETRESLYILLGVLGLVYSENFCRENVSCLVHDLSLQSLFNTWRPHDRLYLQITGGGQVIEFFYENNNQLYSWERKMCLVLCMIYRSSLCSKHGGPITGGTSRSQEVVFKLLSFFMKMISCTAGAMQDF